METIKIYLENMFMNLPNTPEVYKAKQELLQMMEDKYQELKSEGKTENEAIGIVISEFGNLDEIAKDLGIETCVEHAVPEGKKLSLEEAKEYIQDMGHAATGIALGVMFLIISFVGPIVADAFADAGMKEELTDMVGAVSLFLMWALGIGIIIYTNIKKSKWDKMQHENFVTEFSTTEYIQRQWEVYKQSYATTKTLGVVLCIISFIPAIVLDAVHSTYITDSMGGAGLFLFVGVGVFLLISSERRKGSYMRLLGLNDPKSVGGKYTVDQKKNHQPKNPVLRAILSVYWPTVTCIYLIYSFLTFNWHISWIIFVIAGVIQMFLNNLEGEES